MKIRLLPTHSAYALDVDYAPPGFSLLQHQVETYEAVRTQQADVIVHTGMTGDGKSLAGELTALQNPRHRILAMYPTKELIRDQERHLLNEQVRWDTTIAIRRLNAETLDMHGLEEAVDRPTSLRAYLQHAQIVLTVPDIPRYILAGRYLRGKNQNPFRNINILSEYQQFTFDEFHLFDQQQATAVLTDIIFLHYYGWSTTFLLQSATPEPEVLEALERAGLSVHEIRGHYLHQEETPPESYRTILQGVDLEIVSGDVATWLTEHADKDLLPTLQSGGQRIAALFNSVFAALSVFPELKHVLRGYRVAHNTGLSPRSMRDNSLEADVVLGTATVDIGVDLKINHLIFEAHDVASFKQRLGRLGRHAGYAEDHQFDRFRAVACVPPWIKAALEERCEAVMTRENLFAMVNDIFPKPRRVFAYNKLWGWFPAYHAWHRLRHPVVREQNKDIAPVIKQKLSDALFPNTRYSLDAKITEFKQLFKDRPRRDAIDAFRGSSEMTALIVNEHYAGSEKYQFYDLLRVARAAKFELLDLDETCQAAVRDGVSEKTIKRNNPVVALQWQGVLFERRKLYLTIDRTEWLEHAEEFPASVVVTRGVYPVITPSPDLGDAPRRIRSRKLVVRVIMHRSRYEVQRYLKLGMYFSLYDFETYDGQTGCIALGRDALLLDAAALRLRDEGGGAFII